MEELGYYTTLLYNINDDGTLESHYIELGEREQVCFGDCQYGINVNFFDLEGEQYNEWEQWINIDADDGDKLISNADLELQSVGTFDSNRPDCENAYCWYQVFFKVLDDEGEVFATFDNSQEATNGGDVPAYEYSYTMDGLETIDYVLQWGTEDEICDNVIGCVNDMYMVDESINQYGLWLYSNNDTLVDDGDVLIDRIKMNPENNAVYEYTKDVTGEMCPEEFDFCDEYIPTYFYDLDGTLMNEQWTPNRLVQVPGGEIIPLYIEYYITEDSTTTLEEGLCTTSDGCWRSYEIDEDWISAYYEQGDEVYETIVLDNSDKEVITSETLTSEICTDIDGCYLGEDIVYTIVDPLGATLYEFTGWVYADYGETLPYHVIAVYDETDETASDVEVITRKQSTEDIKTCEEATCLEWVEFVIDTGTEWEWEYLGSTYMTFVQDDQIIRRIMFPEDTEPTDQEDNMICRQEDGCMMYTNNFVILDELGNEIDVNDDWTSVPVLFENGEQVPTEMDFEATFVMTNITYQTSRLYIYDFIYNLNSVVILDEDLYLIESNSWDSNSDNVILTYNETTGRYSAMYTNLSTVTEISKLGDSYVAINEDENAILKFTYNIEESSNNYYFFDEVNLTDGLSINGVNDLIIDYDGSIYFQGVDNFITDITGTIAEDGTVTIDTEVVERVIVRVRPIN